MDGDYLVVVTSGSLAAQSAVIPTVFPHGRLLSQGLPVTLQYGEDREHLQLQLYEEMGFDVSGSVRSSQDLAGRGVVRLVAVDAQEVGSDLELATTTLEPNGRFLFRGIAQGRYRLEVYVRQTSGFAGASVGDRSSRLTRGDLAAGVSGAVNFSISDRSVADLVVSVSDPGSIMGNVVIPSESGNVLNGSILAVVMDNGRAVIPATIDREGRFQATGLVPGRYFLQFANPPSGGWTIESVSVRGVTTQGPLAINGETISEVIVRMTNKLPQVTGSARSSVGTVLEPDPDASVLLFPVAVSEWELYGLESARLRSARVAEDGTFSIRGVPKGEYWIVAVKDEELRNWQAKERLPQFAKVATKIAVNEDVRTELKVVHLNSAK